MKCHHLLIYYSNTKYPSCQVRSKLLWCVVVNINQSASQCCTYPLYVYKCTWTSLLLKPTTFLQWGDSANALHMQYMCLKRVVTSVVTSSTHVRIYGYLLVMAWGEAGTAIVSTICCVTIASSIKCLWHYWWVFLGVWGDKCHSGLRSPSDKN